MQQSERTYYIDSGDKSKALRTIDMNRSENSLRTSAVSFAYQSENNENPFKKQLDDQINENIKLRKQLVDEIEKNNALNSNASSRFNESYKLQQIEEDLNKKYEQQIEKFTLILNKKESEIIHLTQYIRQLEKDLQLSASKKISIDKSQYEYKINLLLNENEKLNQVLCERIEQVEKYKQKIESLERDNLQNIDKYEQLLNEKNNLYSKEKQSIEKTLTQQLNSNKNEFFKQIQALNAQNSQLSGLIMEQKEKLDQMEQQLENNHEQLQSERLQINSKDNELKDIQNRLERKEREYEDLILQFNELEKKLVLQNQQVKQIEKELENNHYDSVCQQMQAYYDEQIKAKESSLKQEYESQNKYLMSQLNENQTFIEELQNHLAEIHRQLTQFKQEKIQLKEENQELLQKLEDLSQSKDYSLPSFNNTTNESSFEQRRNSHSNSSCINQLKQYSLTKPPGSKSYSQQFQQKLKKSKQEPSPKKLELDSFGNRERSTSCLNMGAIDNNFNKTQKFVNQIGDGSSLNISNQLRQTKNINMSSVSDEEEEEEINPIEQFKIWKSQMTDRLR